jgi:hypothetical protein
LNDRREPETTKPKRRYTMDTTSPAPSVQTEPEFKQRTPADTAADAAQNAERCALELERKADIARRSAKAARDHARRAFDLQARGMREAAAICARLALEECQTASGAATLVLEDIAEKALAPSPAPTPEALTSPLDLIEEKWTDHHSDHQLREQAQLDAAESRIDGK